MALEKSSHPFGLAGTSNAAHVVDGQGGNVLKEFIDFSWRSTVTSAELESLNETYRVPRAMDFVVPPPAKWEVDS